MDLTKYNNDLSDVTDYLSELGLSKLKDKHDGRYNKYSVPKADFEIHVYSFIKQGDTDLFKYCGDELLALRDIVRRFMNISHEESKEFTKDIKRDIHIINIIPKGSRAGMVTITNLEDLDNYLVEYIPFYKRDTRINNILKL